MADRKLAELCEEAVETAVESEFLVPVEVRNQNGGEDIETIMCGLDATAQDVKKFLRKRLIKNDDNPTELHLYDVNGNDLFWQMPMARPPHATKLTLHVVPLDTRLDALYQMVGMGDESERDQMMERMMVPRLPRDCPGNHSLPEEQAANRGQENNVLMCAKCCWYAFRGHGCNVCQFELCVNCLREDQGLTVVADPRSEIVVIATRIGTKFAEVLCNSGLGLYSTSIRWRSDLGEILPSLWSDDRNRHGRHGVTINDQAQVLHKGVRLLVQLSQKIRRLLDANNNGEKKATNLYPGETITILSDGASLLDLKTYCKAISESEAWPVVTDELKRRVSSSEEFQKFEDKPNSYEISIKLVSFQPEQVVYEVGARINSNALAAKGTFAGECGYNFGCRSRRIGDQLRLAGATLE